MGPVVDAETGFQYLRARYYDAATGQFLTRDPIEAQTREAYGYVGGNPLNGTDPSGLYPGEGLVEGVVRAGAVVVEAADDASEWAYRNRDTIADVAAITACLGGAAASGGTLAAACVPLSQGAVAIGIWKSADQNDLLPGGRPADWGSFALDSGLEVGLYGGGEAAGTWLMRGRGPVARYLRKQRPDAEYLLLGAGGSAELLTGYMIGASWC